MLFSKKYFLIQAEPIKHENVSKETNKPAVRYLASILTVYHCKRHPFRSVLDFTSGFVQDLEILENLED